MIRVEYDNEHLSGSFHCPFCGNLIELAGNVHTYSDSQGIERTHPDARNSIYNHFHYDKNAFIAECPAIDRVDDTSWEAVERPTDRIVAKGRIVVEVGPNSRGPIVVLQDEPQ